LLEGERELISGFNIEMGSIMFIFLFLREYGMILVLAAILRIAAYQTVLFGIFIATFMLLLRRCFPRVRYDVLIRCM